MAALPAGDLTTQLALYLKTVPSGTKGSNSALRDALIVLYTAPTDMANLLWRRVLDR